MVKNILKSRIMIDIVRKINQGEYYVVLHANNQQYGPVDEAKMKELAASGVINASTFVWTQGMAAWAPISQTA
jgi:hypothetical protein